MISSLANDITAIDRMAQLIVRKLDDGVKERLRARAKRNGRSLEAEAREILREVADKERARPSSSPGFGTRVSARFKGIGFTRKELEDFNRAIDEVREERTRFVRFDP
jgi:plasmid stability protein